MESLQKIKFKIKGLFFDTLFIEGAFIALAASLLSLYRMESGQAPLGMAFLAAVWCSVFEPYFAAAGVIAGSLCAGAHAEAAASLIISIVIFFIAKRRNINKIYRYLITAASLLAVYPVFGNLSLEGFTSYFGGICFTVFLSLLMTNALNGIQSVRCRRLITDEQLLTISLFFGLIALSLGNFRLLGISPGAIFTALICMYAAYARGLAGVACAAAVACGRVFGCGGDLLFIAVMCSCTLLCACTRPFGKWGACCGFIFPALIFSVLINGTGALSIIETLFTGCIFAITRKSFFELLEYNSAAKHTERIQLRLDNMTSRLLSLSRVLDELSKLFENSDDTADGFINRQLSGISGSLFRLVKEDGRVKKQRFFVEIGCAGCPKKGNRETGDSLEIREFNGKLMAAISDGMGSGHNARRESSQTVELMCDLMTAGFRLDEAAECANRLLMLREGDEMYATLDAILFDTSEGMMSLAKHGAPPSYILRDGKLNTLYAEALPVGMIAEARPAVCNVRLQRGDIVIMMSDGVSDALGSELACALTERSLNSENANIAASSLLELARRSGKIKDDMSVIVAMVS